MGYLVISTVRFEVDGIMFTSSEQAYMFFKAFHFNDMESVLSIMRETNPAKCKKLGRKVKNFDDNEWKIVCMDYMEKVCTEKFRQNISLLQYLTNTNDKILVEASPWDCYWGIGLYPDSVLRFDEANWRGLNKLGIVLMNVRKKLCIPELLNL